VEVEAFLANLKVQFGRLQQLWTLPVAFSLTRISLCKVGSLTMATTIPAQAWFELAEKPRNKRDSDEHWSLKIDFLGPVEHASFYSVDNVTTAFVTDRIHGTALDNLHPHQHCMF
jgi:hypothetical protein